MLMKNLSFFSSFAFNSCSMNRRENNILAPQTYSAFCYANLFFCAKSEIFHKHIAFEDIEPSSTFYSTINQSSISNGYNKTFCHCSYCVLSPRFERGIIRQLADRDIPACRAMCPLEESDLHIQVRSLMCCPLYQGDVRRAGVSPREQISTKFGAHSELLAFSVQLNIMRFNVPQEVQAIANDLDRKSTRLNSSH